MYSLLQKNSLFFVIYRTYFSGKYVVYSPTASSIPHPHCHSVPNRVQLTIGKLKNNSKVDMLLYFTKVGCLSYHVKYFQKEKSRIQYVL